MSRSDKEANISYTLNRNYLCLEFESFSLSQEIEAEKRAVSGGTKKVVSPRKETKVGGQVLEHHKDELPVLLHALQFEGLLVQHALCYQNAFCRG